MNWAALLTYNRGDATDFWRASLARTLALSDAGPGDAEAHASSIGDELLAGALGLGVGRGLPRIFGANIGAPATPVILGEPQFEGAVPVDPPNSTGRCCVKGISAKISENKPIVGERPVQEGAKDGKTEKYSVMSWNVAIEVEMFDANPCSCECCEVQYFVSWHTETTQAGGSRHVFSTEDVLPPEDRHYFPYGGPGAAIPDRSIAREIKDSPFKISTGFPGGKSSMLVHYPTNRGRASPGFIEDIGMTYDPIARKKYQRGWPGVTDPKPRTSKGVIEHPVNWLRHANNLDRFNSLPSLKAKMKALHDLIVAGKRDQLDALAVTSGSEDSPDTEHSDCKVKITDQPAAEVSAGSTLAMSRTYLVTVTPSGGEGCASSGDRAQREFTLSGSIKGGSKRTDAQSHDVGPFTKEQGQSPGGFPVAPPQ